MKKFLWILVLALCLSACGNGADFLTEDYLFFSDFNLVSVMDGEVVSVISDMKNLGDDTYAYPVALSDDLFVFVTGSEGVHTSTLMKIVGKDFEEIYKIKDQEFLPSAKVYDKV